MHNINLPPTTERKPLLEFQFDGNPLELMRAWLEGGEKRQCLIDQMESIKDETFGFGILENLTTRLEGADQEEKKEIITALSYLGTQAPGVNILAARVLVSLLKTFVEFENEILRGLHDKTQICASSLVIDRPLNEFELEELSFGVPVLIKALQDPNIDREHLLKGVGWYGTMTRYRAEVHQVLLQLVQDEDRGVARSALFEMATYLKDDTVLDLFKKLYPFEAMDTMAEDEIEDLVDLLERLDRAELFPYLKKLADHSNDYVHRTATMLIEGRD